MSQLPGLHVVTFRRYLAWHDRWKAGVVAMGSRLLMAHKVPWAEYGDMMNRTEEIWAQARADGGSLVGRIACEGPPCEACAHVAGQHACAADVEVPDVPTPMPSCWPRCAFAKGSRPSLPEHCWRRPRRERAINFGT